MGPLHVCGGLGPIAFFCCINPALSLFDANNVSQVQCGLGIKVNRQVAIWSVHSSSVSCNSRIVSYISLCSLVSCRGATVP